jgi:hypothetical protein
MTYFCRRRNLSRGSSFVIILVILKKLLLDRVAIELPMVTLQVGSLILRSKIAKRVHLVSRFNSSSSATTPTSAQPIVELREYNLFPEHAVSYMNETAAAADLRKRLVPLRFFSLPETGGQLHRATHAYYYQSLSEREEKRAKQAADPDWKAYIAQCRPYADTQYSTIFCEARPILELGAQGLARIPAEQQGDSPILELRLYQLKLGYDTVPKFIEYYSDGLPSKLNAPGTDPTTRLLTVMYSEIGALNQVIELWRHGSVGAMEQSRVAARQAPEWRAAIASIASLAVDFTSTIHKPVPFSPIK